MKTDNELIAEFDGWTKDDHEQNYYRHNKQNGFRGMPLGCFYQNMLYHSSWDWLMPVVEKIEMLGVNVDILGGGTRIKWMLPTEEFFTYDKIRYDTNVKINHVYNSVIDFIKWYNTQNSREDFYKAWQELAKEKLGIARDRHSF